MKLFELSLLMLTIYMGVAYLAGKAGLIEAGAEAVKNAI